MIAPGGNVIEAVNEQNLPCQLGGNFDPYIEFSERFPTSAFPTRRSPNLATPA